MSKRTKKLLKTMIPKKKCLNWKNVLTQVIKNKKTRTRISSSIITSSPQLIPNYMYFDNSGSIDIEIFNSLDKELQQIITNPIKLKGI